MMTKQQFKEMGGRAVRHAPGGVFGHLPADERGEVHVTQWKGEDTGWISIAVLQDHPGVIEEVERIHRDEAWKVWEQHREEEIAGVPEETVKMLRSFGYSPAHTGGGCMAWQKVWDDEWLAVIGVEATLGVGVMPEDAEWGFDYMDPDGGLYSEYGEAYGYEGVSLFTVLSRIAELRVKHNSIPLIDGGLTITEV